MKIFITTIQIRHLLRCLKQWIIKPKVGIIGGYHGGNLGDIALGESVDFILKEQSISSGLQTIYNLEKWVKTPHAIIGGGAVGYIESLRRVAKRYANNFKAVALLGVDFNEKEYPSDCIQFIQEAGYVSSRSKMQADRLIQLTGRKNIYHHPDIAFSLLIDYCKKQRELRKTVTHKKLLINVMPLYCKIEGTKLLPLTEYASERPELYEQFNIMHASYKKVIVDLVKQALAYGYAVETIPFTQEDEAYGKYILESLPVKHNGYHDDPIRMIHQMADADWVLATRFHTTIFAAKLGLKISPVAYAIKNEALLAELGIDRTNYISTSDLANGVQVLPDAITVNYDTIDEWEIKSKEAIEMCIHSLYESVH